MRRILFIALAVVLALVSIAGIFMYSGLYNIAADEPHWAFTTQLMQTARTRSIQRHAREVSPPPLDDPQRILKGADQYAEMCAGCHLAPGMQDTVLRQGLYPQPPDLTKLKIDPAAAFWVVKHGVKMSGMPAWGASHDDETLWSIVAFVNRLPALTPQQYTALVDRAPPHDHRTKPAADARSGAKDRGKPAHTHAPGTAHAQ